MPNLITAIALYDFLYSAAEIMLEKYDPCKITQLDVGTVCHKFHQKNYRKLPNLYQLKCCSGCDYLGPEGCMVRCLGCKLSLCTLAMGNLPEHARVVFDVEHMWAKPYWKIFRKWAWNTRPDIRESGKEWIKAAKRAKEGSEGREPVYLLPLGYWSQKTKE